jgi:YD repeat-containing protein
LIDRDPARPAVVDGPNNDYWDHVDTVIELAAARGLMVGLLPTWGDKWNLKWGVGPVVFTPENAEIFGEWIGKRYRERPVIWILGGDRNIETEEHRAIIEAMARGVRRGDGGAHLMTFHPQGGESSSSWFHDADWLDFNLRQNGHQVNFAAYAGTRRDYDRTPVKPVIDGEPLYEDHPIEFEAARYGHSVAADVRRALYWDLFGGACGHTYGHHSVWQMYAPGRAPINAPLLTWEQALDQPGANQMRHGRALLESRPFLSRIPDDELIEPARAATAVPGAGRHRVVATRDADGSYAFVYTPSGRAFGVRLDRLSGTELQAWWYDPRTGEAILGERFARTGTRTFLSPTPGEYVDWVLVLDDVARGYGPPGAPR